MCLDWSGFKQDDSFFLMVDACARAKHRDISYRLKGARLAGLVAADVVEDVHGPGESASFAVQTQNMR